MTTATLLLRSARFHARSHAGVLAGAAVAASILVGALAVGDSVRHSLRTAANVRLGGHRQVHHALIAGDRFFASTLAHRINAHLAAIPNAQADVTAMLLLQGTVARQDGSARARQVRIYGLPGDGPHFHLPDSTAGQSVRRRLPDPGQLWLNASAARHLAVATGDTLVVRVPKPSALSRDAILTPRDDATVALRLVVGGILPGHEGGDLNLHSASGTPFNAFVRIEELAAATGLGGRANLLLAGLGRPESTPTPSSELSSPLLKNALATAWELDDAELTLRAQPPPTPSPHPPNPEAAGWELSSRRIFLEPAIARAALSGAPPASASSPTPVLTYLVNRIEARNRLTPYSMVTAAPAPYTPADLGDDEIVINQWLADDLGVTPGDSLRMGFYLADQASRLVEKEHPFRVREIVPMAGRHLDRSLMPEFPGLSKAESTHDWDAGFELVHKIRDSDEAYWKAHRGTPKAFIRLETGQKLWENRFGSLTAIRWPAIATGGTSLSNVIRSRLSPSEVGLQWQPVGEEARRGAASGQDFGGLFLGFSFFLIVSALLLTSLLFRFSLEQRAAELGTLLAVGWSRSRLLRLHLMEGMLLAGAGALLGSAGGRWYGQAVLRGLNTLWKDAVGGAHLEFHMETATSLAGIAVATLISTATLGLAIRTATRRPARELMAEGFRETAAGRGATPQRWACIGAGLLGLACAIAAATRPAGQQPGLFFGAGALLLIAGILALRHRLQGQHAALARAAAATRLSAFAFRGPARRPGRSTATATLLAAATFLIVSIGVHRLDAGRDATRRSGGTGGFALWGESSLPILQDLNTTRGREFHGLDDKVLARTRIVPLRVREGDEASCLNLNRPVRPRLLGVDPRTLESLGAFSFASRAPGTSGSGWALLSPAGRLPDDPLPAIGDAASIQWALGRKLGDTLEYVDEAGRPFRVRLVAGLANSILQGSLVISEADFLRRFPTHAGHRAFLIDVPGEDIPAVSAALSRALEDQGFEVGSTRDRLARFHAVQNTYLGTFQVLGGLGLILGSVGLGIVVLRNVLERRQELGALQAVGFTPTLIRRMILMEHAGLLVAGLAIGLGAAAIAVIPTWTQPALRLPVASLAATLGLVLIHGLLWTWAAARHACSGNLLAALRSE